jgi:hypothetical protein
MLHKHEWVQAEGTVVQVFVRPGHAEADKFGVEVRPANGEPWQAEAPRPHEKHFRQPSVGDVTGFLVDTKSQKVEFDISDHRNIAAHGLAALLGGATVVTTGPGAHSGAGMGLAEMMGLAVSGMAAAEAALGELAHGGMAGVGGAPAAKWAVPAECPNCGAKVEQAVASNADSPRCGYCREPLPVQPYGAAPPGPSVTG